MKNNKRLWLLLTLLAVCACVCVCLQRGLMLDVRLSKLALACLPTLYSVLLKQRCVFVAIVYCNNLLPGC